MKKRRDFLSELAFLKKEIDRIKKADFHVLLPYTGYIINPLLNILKLSWRSLPDIINNKKSHVSPEAGQDYIIIWKHPADGKVYVRSANNEDLLAIKLVAEKHDLIPISKDTKTPLAFFKQIIKNAVKEGLIIRAESKIKRARDFLLESNIIHEKYIVSDVFTLQWHITQACDLNCRHCYDRADRKRLTFAQAIKVLEDMDDFCEKMNLGNPVPEEQIEKLLSIKKPLFLSGKF